jgi:hypothetical protein
MQQWCMSRRSIEYDFTQWRRENISFVLRHSVFYLSNPCNQINPRLNDKVGQA